MCAAMRAQGAACAGLRVRAHHCVVLLMYVVLVYVLLSSESIA